MVMLVEDLPLYFFSRKETPIISTGAIVRRRCRTQRICAILLKGRCLMEKKLSERENTKEGSAETMTGNKALLPSEGIAGGDQNASVRLQRSFCV